MQSATCSWESVQKGLTLHSFNALETHVAA